MKKILMITTGGTLACGETENGLAPKFSADEILSYIPEVRTFCDVDTLCVSNIDSTNVTIKHWQMMVKAIEDNYEKYDAFVITHGTDTLAYTSSALSYMIQNSKKPIVLTGSQKPIKDKDTDAKINLLDSFIYASDDNSYGVSVVLRRHITQAMRLACDKRSDYP